MKRSGTGVARQKLPSPLIENLARSRVAGILPSQLPLAGQSVR